MPHRKWGLALAAAAAVCGLGEAQGDEALAKIKTIVIIYAENRSFDHLYGFFSGANGIANATEEQRRSSTTTASRCPISWSSVPTASLIRASQKCPTHRSGLTRRPSMAGPT